MATKSKNISLKSKFQDNTPNLYTKQDLKNDKLSKIKVSLQKSKIKNKKAIISLNKKVYKNKQTTDFINTSFSELIKSNPNYTIPKFFEVYENLFYDIPKKGEKSHNSLIVQSQEYINDYMRRQTLIPCFLNLMNKAKYPYHHELEHLPFVDEAFQ